jgi:methylated-DNA-[protein]-cysteine S-methyltransferase
VTEYRTFTTEWGWSAIVAGSRGLQATFLPHPTKAGVEADVASRCPRAKPNARLLPELVRTIQAYFAGEPVRFNVRLDLSSLGDFRRRVFAACRKIPRGKTATYADLARAAGSPQAARAVGSAMANNPLPLIVPCHRVVRSDGSLGGFSAPQGQRLKRRLIRLETGRN